MRNDKERKAYIDDSSNWSVVGEYGGRSNDHPGAVRISRLSYGGESWYKVEIMQEFTQFSYVRSNLETVRGWRALGTYGQSEDGAVFGEHVSVTQILNAIKEIDMGRR